MRSDASVRPSDRVWTLPNALSMLRLLLVPVFLWALFTSRDGLAMAVLMVSGASDYFDGKIARRFGLVSRMGQLLDPIADRLYILTTILALGWREIIPWWLVGLLLARDLFIVVLALIGRRHKVTDIAVHFIGKAATFNLLYAFPLLLLGHPDGLDVSWVLPIAWAFAWWGLALYWVGGLIYAVQLRDAIRSRGASPVGRSA
ncbi:MAG: CDP-alcohol phosphatidyltransferase family protein [Micrococcales bacterium]|nr:CDP-alcohol phosphatidyltransferase family protein [Micrococcales bacterium]